MKTLLEALVILYIVSCSKANNVDYLRIVGGEVTGKNQYPHQVALFKNGYFQCGGSIIGSSWVLTASHCIQNSKAENFKVFSGSNDLADISGGSFNDVEKLIQHEDYYYSIEFDIALVKINGSFLLGESRKIIPLNTKNIPVGTQATVLGWGRIQTGGRTSSLLKCNIFTKVSQARCEAMAGIKEGIFCLGHPEGQGICNGDSGGGAIYNGTLIGVVNFGSACGSMDPDGYADVAYFYDWIDWNMW